MSNEYFQFKQFRIEQGSCAMKVSTDACIQGAWTPVRDDVRHVLDIGAGTGLLSLMLAQRNANVQIDAIEIDSSAAEQAAENVLSSPWRDRIKIINADAREYSSVKKYDLIICNPPFFNNSLTGDDIGRNIARHTLSLSYDDLLNSMNNLLADSGYISVLLPADEFMIFEQMADEKGLHAFRQLNVKHTIDAKVKRIVGLFGKAHNDACLQETLVIKDGINYTSIFIDLLHPYYSGL